MLPDSPDITIRCGADFAYEAVDPTHIVLMIQPRENETTRILSESLEIHPNIAVDEYEDAHRNTVRRFELPRGRTTIRHDALVSVSSLRENHDIVDLPLTVKEMSPAILRYTLPSRYCDSDRLMNFAFDKFGQVPHGLQRVQAICDWAHQNIEYRWGSGSPHVSASEVISSGFGICRDFAHVAIALCRCFNLPARYVTGHLPDVACLDAGSPMDFHAYLQVYLGGRWNSFDARFNTSRIGRIDIACGFDAVECAFSTLYGAAILSWFTVWNYQVDPAEVHIGDPIDLNTRLDGTPQLRFAPRHVEAAS
jgi:transglutaminase-like putative cysteine protease